MLDIPDNPLLEEVRRVSIFTDTANFDYQRDDFEACWNTQSPASKMNNLLGDPVLPSLACEQAGIDTRDWDMLWDNLDSLGGGHLPDFDKFGEDAALDKIGNDTQFVDVVSNSPDKVSSSNPSETNAAAIVAAMGPVEAPVAVVEDKEPTEAAQEDVRPRVSGRNGSPRNQVVERPRQRRRARRNRKLYEMKPFKDPNEERKRLNAINSKKNRERKKNLIETMLREMAELRSLNKKVREEAERDRKELELARQELKSMSQQLRAYEVLRAKALQVEE